MSDNEGKMCMAEKVIFQCEAYLYANGSYREILRDLSFTSHKIWKENKK